MEQQFEYKEIDQEGLDTLDTMSEARKLNAWQYEDSSRHLSGKILEIGSGVGNISAFYVEENRDITLSDIRDNYLEKLTKKFEKGVSPNKIIKMDLVASDFEEKYAKHIGTFDGLFALNVVEHIEDDTLAISNAKKLLKPGGKMVILVPAYQALYNGLDKALFHYRRYNKRSLNELFLKNDLSIDKSYYFNFAGILGWFVSGKLQKNNTIPGGQLKLYNSLVPIFKLVDLITFRKIGLSVVCVGTK